MTIQFTSAVKNHLLNSREMKLFWKSKKKTLKITQTDREWVESNFRWLLNEFNEAHWKSSQIIISQEYFPETFKSREIKVENILIDCCNHLDLDYNLFLIELLSDIRDTNKIPYEFGDHPLDCLIDFNEKYNKYQIVINKDILKHPNRFISLFCYEMSKVRLIESKIDFNSGGDSKYFLFLASVYFGYGVIISKNLIDIGISLDSGWESKWFLTTDFPYPILAYTLALYSIYKEEDNPFWVAYLPEEIRIEFELSLEFVKTSKKDLIEAIRIDDTLNPNKLFDISVQLYFSGNYEKAIEILEQIAANNEKFHSLSIVYNNIGYYKMRQEKYLESIPAFMKAIEINPNSGFATDNLGHALIMSGELEKGKEYLERALEIKNNDHGYTYRNLASYFQRKGDYESAELNFQKAFELHEPVDLLDFFYGCYLLERGEKERALEHLQISSELGENEGVKLFSKLQNV